MAAARLTPRQKMINLMYLVFIAMMAMNVDREVLRSFEDVNEALQLSNKLTDDNNETFYDQIRQKSEKGEEGYAKIAEQANVVKDRAQKAYDAIEALKTDLRGATEYTEPKQGTETKYNALQNTDKGNKIFFVTQNTTTPKVAEMLSTVEGYAKYISDNGDAASKNRVKSLFDFSNKNNKSWVVNTFYDQPMIATLTNLTRLQTNVLTEEGNMVRNLLSNKLKEEIELKAFVPIVASPKYVKQGESFKVTVGFGAYDTSLKGSITLNGRSIPLQNGKGEVTMTAPGPGMHTLAGSITYQTPDGQSKAVQFNETYEVPEDIIKKATEGDAVVTADKMNVVYRGVDNPVSAAVMGLDGGFSMSANGGSLSKSGTNKWNFRPGGGESVSFTVSGRTSGGKAVTKSFSFRIKNIPRAVGAIRGANVVTIPASSVPNQSISASVPDFLFPTTVNVTGFKVKVPGQAAKVISGSSLRGVTAKPGDQVLVFDISATVNGISQSGISPVLINVQ